MSQGITVEFRDEKALRKLNRLGTHLVNDMVEATAIEAGQLLREHFYDLQSKRGRPDGSGFYRQAGDLTFHRATRTGALVGTSRIGVRQRLKGGTIRPKNAGALTIPIHPDAEGVRAKDSSLPDLEMIRTESGLFLVDTSGGQFIPYYILLKSVTQQADPSVIPPDGAFTAVARDALAAVIRTYKRS